MLDFTTPYAHQQNGKAKRSMRTLLNMARTMLADSGLPQKFWTDVVNTAVYTQNFIPATAWSGQHQDISHLPNHLVQQHMLIFHPKLAHLNWHLAW